MRRTLTPFSAFFSCSIALTCQEIASPSRSGSVARYSVLAPFRALAMAPTCFSQRETDCQSIAKSCTGRTEPSFGGRSRTWPAGQHGVSAAEIAVDGLGLGGGLDDDDV
jgi:hypothetical protein